MKKKLAISIILLLTGFLTYAQSFSGLYSIGKTSFKVRALSEEDAKNGLFNIVYYKGDKNGTMASLSEYTKFEFAFDEYEGDIYLGTFYFTKAWKGKPLIGYYIRANSKKN